jgi:hypothetical protein
VDSETLDQEWAVVCAAGDSSKYFLLLQLKSSAACLQNCVIFWSISVSLGVYCCTVTDLIIQPQVVFLTYHHKCEYSVAVQCIFFPLYCV